MAQLSGTMGLNPAECSAPNIHRVCFFQCNLILQPNLLPRRFKAPTLAMAELDAFSRGPSHIQDIRDIHKVLTHSSCCAHLL